MSIASERRMAAGMDERTVRAVALPAEHGGWGLLAEPLLLGLCIAPSAPGVALAGAAVCGFLARHPARLASGDMRRGVTYRRTRLAIALAGANAAGAALGLTLALLWSDGPLALALAPVLPVLAVYLAFDLRLRGREAAAELAGACSLSVTAGALAAAAGWPLERAWPLWILAGGRALTSVVEVRTRLRRRRGLSASAAVPLLAHGAFVAVSLALAIARWAPLIVPVVPLALLARAAWNLRSAAPPVAPKTVGWGEVQAGLLTVAAWVVIYRILG